MITAPPTQEEIHRGLYGKNAPKQEAKYPKAPPEKRTFNGIVFDSVLEEGPLRRAVQHAECRPDLQAAISREISIMDAWERRQDARATNVGRTVSN
jgi:hypothetical protein